MAESQHHINFTPGLLLLFSFYCRYANATFTISYILVNIMPICCQTLAWISIMEDQVWKTQCYLKKDIQSCQLFDRTSSDSSSHSSATIISCRKVQHIPNTYIHSWQLTDIILASKQANTTAGNGKQIIIIAHSDVRIY